ncbi:MAG: DUF4367 domain-containing protein [Clostridia bacterium]|nr:DUF4367 domain-containing protein [Clostridia bacterium]
MKNEKNIDELIKKALTEYVDADTKEETAEVTYSKEHEARMKQMFEDMTKDTKNKKSSREIVIRIKFDLAAKIAVAVVALIVVTLTLSTGIKAWKENNKLEMFGDSDEYSWLLSENTSELYETKTSKADEEYVKGVFFSLSGELNDVMIENKSKSQKIEFVYQDQIVSIKIRKGVNYTINSENMTAEEIIIDELTIYGFVEPEQNSYRWKLGEYIFDLYGNFTKEDAMKIIKSINYEKIETNF